MNSLSSFNYWNRQVANGFAHSAQAILRSTGESLNASPKNEVASEGCGAGSCNCGGGCNGECGGEE